MSDKPEPNLSVAHSPDASKVSYDLQRTLLSVLSVRTRIPDDAMTASLLGTEREGHGVLISEDGLVLTIGYLITEAESVWLVDGLGRPVPAHVVGYDQGTGFGLVQALQRLDLPILPLGNSSELHQNDPVIFAGQGGIKHAVDAKVILKREFAGYWEYLLDEAIFTAPAHKNWGGGALIGSDGTLCGIGSLLVQHVTQHNETHDANMVVPIDLFKPIFDDLLRYGRVNRPYRPWLGMMTTEYEGHLVVAGMIDNGPAYMSGIEVGDVVLEVSGVSVSGLAHMFREIWSLGTAGVLVPLTIYRKEITNEYIIESASRSTWLRSPTLH